MSGLAHLTVHPAQGPSLGAWTLWRVFWRSLFLQASWNPEGMQNLGLAYALFPALRVLYPDPVSLHHAVQRHLVVFNTHPYSAAAILGGVLFHEQRIARFGQPPESVTTFKAALMGPLAAVGDGFFWLSLKPAVGALCAALVPLIGVWAAPLFLVLFNLVHLTLRARFFVIGLRLGDRLVAEVARASLPAKGAYLRVVAAASAGGLAAWLAIAFGAKQGGEVGPLLAAGCLLVGGVGYWAVARVSSYLVLLLVALLAALVGGLL